MHKIFLKKTVKKEKKMKWMSFHHHHYFAIVLSESFSQLSTHLCRIHQRKYILLMVIGLSYSRKTIVLSVNGIGLRYRLSFSVLRHWENSFVSLLGNRAFKAFVFYHLSLKLTELAIFIHVSFAR